MKKVLALAALVVLLGTFSSLPANASPQPDIGTCLQYTTAHGLRSAAILQGLPLTGDQKRELKSRLASYNSLRGYQGIDDLGLSPEVVTEINRRIQVQVDEWNKHPLGWPCMVFKAPAKTKAFIRDLLLSNGFDSSGLKIRLTSPRQFQFGGYRDGFKVVGVIAKTGNRQLVVKTEVPSGPVRTSHVTTPFEA